MTDEEEVRAIELAYEDMRKIRALLDAGLTIPEILKSLGGPIGKEGKRLV
jgi:hypothetical protein